MKKIKILIALVLLFVIAGCAMESDDRYNGVPGDTDEQEEVMEVQSSVNRKIIYTVNAHISTKDLDDTYKSIMDSLNSDEWAESENLSKTTVFLTLRIKTERLDSFIDSLVDYGEVGNFNKDAKDVSLQYENNTNKIASLQAELDRLNELYEEANINEMITISTRITEVDRQLKQLTGELKQFDSLVDYSVVHLKIYEHKLEKEPSFGSSIGQAFVGGWNAVVTLLKYIVIALSAILPFMVIIVPVGGAVYFGVKYNKRKKNK